MLQREHQGKAASAGLEPDIWGLSEVPEKAEQEGRWPNVSKAPGCFQCFCVVQGLTSSPGPQRAGRVYASWGKRLWPD